MGLVRELAADADLAALRAAPAWSEVIARLERNARPVGSPEPVFTLADSGFVPEDLAYDVPRGRWLVSSVRRGSVVAVDAAGAASDFIPAGAWAVQGMALDASRERLWVATSALPQSPAAAPADSGRAAILRYHLPSGRLERRYDFPADRPHAPGDLTAAANGELYAGDSGSGAVYVIREGADSIATLVPAGVLRSAQQPAVAPNGAELLVADYSRGIAVVSRRDGTVRWLRPAATVALTGIDGLLVDRGEVIAVQNGVTPHRVIRLRLNPEGTSVLGYDVLLQDPAWIIEPTHAFVGGDTLHVIANSGWDALADDGSIRPGATLVPGRVVRIPLR
jgi:sugar lactone lactonase YvrE